MSLKLISCMCAAFDLMADVDLDSLIAWKEDNDIANDQLMEVLAEYYDAALQSYETELGLEGGVDTYEIAERMVSRFLGKHPDFPANTLSD
jgi:hypothetical protein